MADTDIETLANGIEGLSAEEEERLKQRPADIDADVREMERRKRVEALMSSKLFREELERVLDQQMNEGADAPLLQRIKEMVGGKLHTGSLRGPSCVLPINDIRGIEGVGYEKGEKILRCKLAAVYRLVDLFGWTQSGISGQITARLNTALEQVLTTPRGLLPHEVTASSLVKVDMQGVVQEQGTTNFPVNVAGFSLHASVHAARPDVRCVVHVRSAAALAVSAMRGGLLPLCAEAALLGDIAYHHVPPGILDNEERDKLVRALGPSAKVLVLNNGGVLCCGETLEEAFFQAKNLTTACDVQLRLATIPLDNLTLLEPEQRKQMYDASRKPPAEGVKWRVGGEEFEALMRMLDNAGFRTGYIYRHPLIKNEVPKPKSDVEVPPAVSSLGYLLEEEELYKQGLWKKGGKTGERTRWLNSPNVYQKVEVLETGTSDPKKITKWVDANNDEWVQDGSPAHSSTPVKIDAALQFVPKNTNPKEFKLLQQQIKDNRRADKISAGPQSHILEGVTWDEAARLTAEDAHATHTGDHVVLMGAASKGIIQRGYQHNATMYAAPYARNPFDHVTDREIDDYKKIIEKKQRGEYDTDLSESEAISGAQITSPASVPSETEEESRDEHRVLRIETKQAPMRSQPEVVLSDASAFLNSERAHAERTKGTQVTSEAFPINPKEISNITNSRNKHKFSRALNFDSFIRAFDSNANCKPVSRHMQTDTVDCFTRASTCSLNSVASLDWDYKPGEYQYRTRSLPKSVRGKNFCAHNLFRTHSHAGFVNSRMKDPKPEHFHVPKCRTCGDSNSYFYYENLGTKFCSVDDLPQKCAEEMQFIVKTKLEELPVYKVDNALLKDDIEFIESQEFDEDCYIDIEDQRAIQTEKSNQRNASVSYDAVIKQLKDKIFDDGIYKADYAFVEESAETKNETFTTDTFVTCGEYLNFSSDFDLEQSYDASVRGLIQKDIRNYTVPIKYYCEDYMKDISPKKSPRKLKEILKPLDPILEESKISSGDDSTGSNKNKPNLDSTENEQVNNRDLSVVELFSKDKVDVGTEIVSQNVTQQVEVPDDSGAVCETKNSEVVVDALDAVLNKVNEPIFIYDDDEIAVANKSSQSSEYLSIESSGDFEILEVVEEVLETILREVSMEIKPLNFDGIGTEPTFSITKMIEDFEVRNQIHVDDLSFVSEVDTRSEADKVAESIMYFLLDSAFQIYSTNQVKPVRSKTVVTVVDVEDILFTATPLWNETEYVSVGKMERDECCFENAEKDIDISAIVDDVLNDFDEVLQSMDDGDVSGEDTELRQDTYTTIEDTKTQTMNTAFVVDNSIFNETKTLYESEESILGSPFVKSAPILPMTQIEQRGGLKYWLSFDDYLPKNEEVVRSFRKYTEEKVASFIKYETDDECDVEVESNDFKSAGARVAEFTTDSKHTFVGSDVTVKPEPRLRRHSSWPPYDETVFYRILTKFRMSESFDPSDLDKTHYSF